MLNLCFVDQKTIYLLVNTNLPKPDSTQLKLTKKHVRFELCWQVLSNFVTLDNN